MKKHLLILLICPIVLKAQDYSKVVSSNNDFAKEFLLQLQSKPDVLISPFSISSAVAMIYNGAQGPTKTEIQKALHYTADKELNAGYSELLKALAVKSSTTELSVANKIWLGKDRIAPNPNFISLTQKYYQSDLETLNFGEPKTSRIVVNQWAAQHTNNKIPEILPDDFITDDMVMILTNAVYFKGKWENEFDPKDTKLGKFTNDQKKLIDVSYMVNSGKFKGYSDDYLQMVEFPYIGDQFSLMVVLPTGSMDEMWNHVEDELLGINLLIRACSEQTYSLIQLPKFKTSFDLDLKPTFQSLGMNKAFGDGADFSLLGDAGGPIKISKIVHSTFIEINEEGTEAAAVTAIGAVARSASVPQQFIVDRPFVYIIRHIPSNTILFIGKCSNPKY